MEPKPIDYSLVENLDLEKYRRTFDKFKVYDKFKGDDKFKEYDKFKVKVERVFWSLALSTEFMDFWKVLEDTDMMRDLFYDFYSIRSVITRPYIGFSKDRLKTLFGSLKDLEVNNDLKNHSAALLIALDPYRLEYQKGEQKETSIALDFADGLQTSLPSPSDLFRRIAMYLPGYDGKNVVTIQHPLVSPSKAKKLTEHLSVLIRRVLFRYLVLEIEVFLNKPQNTFTGKMTIDSPTSAVRHVLYLRPDFRQKTNRQIARYVVEMFCTKKGAELDYDSVLNAVLAVKDE
jgi:hypothetical protein